MTTPKGTPTTGAPPTAPTNGNRGESVHRWDVRRALLDGPKTAQQVTNWARERGNQNIDRPLAESILRSLIKAQEVGIDVTVNAGKPPVFVATASMRDEEPGETASVSIPPIACAPVPVSGEVAPIESDGAKKVLRDIRAMGLLREGQSYTAFVPSGANPADFAQRLRNLLACIAPTKLYAWSVVREQEADQHRVLITNRGLKLRSQPTNERPGTTVPAPPFVTADVSQEQAEEVIRRELSKPAVMYQTPSQNSKTITLRSGGTITMEFSLDLFALSAEDRAFFFDMVDRFRGYAEDLV